MKTITITAYKTRGTRDNYTIDAAYRGRLVDFRDGHSGRHDGEIRDLLAAVAILHGFTHYRLIVGDGRSSMPKSGRISPTAADTPQPSALALIGVTRNASRSA